MVQFFLVSLLCGVADCARISRQHLQHVLTETSSEQSSEQSTEKQPAGKQWVRVGQDNTVCGNGWTHHVRTEEECRAKAEKKGRQYYSFTTDSGGRCKYEKKCNLKFGARKNWITHEWQEVAATAESPNEAATEPVDEAAAESADEAATEWADEAAAESVDEAATESADEAAAESADEAAAESADEAVATTSAAAIARPGAECQPLDFYEACAKDATWAFQEGRHQDWASDAYAMLDVPLENATQDDFQKLFYCGMERQCAPPCECSVPPCNVCPGLRAPDDLEDSEQMANYLNELYYGFQEHDAGSPNGVYMTMHDRFQLYTDHECHNGWTNDRTSASVYNHLMMLEDDKLKVTMKRHTGFVYSPELVDSRLGKCSYMFDGATFNRFNRACGCNSRVSTCGPKGSAYEDQCGEDYDHDCGPQDFKEVEMCSCDTRGVDEVQLSTQIQCFFKGTAYDHDNIDTANDQTRRMIEERLKRQNVTSSHGSQLEIWNELVLDSALLKESLLENPNGIIHAFTYVKSSSWGRRKAESMRDAFMTQWNVTTKVPIIGIDDGAHVSQREPVFFA